MPPIRLREPADGLVRFVAPNGEDAQLEIAKVLRGHCARFARHAAEAAQGTSLEHAYQISATFSDELRWWSRVCSRCQGVRDVTLLLQEPTLDV